jgi:hypothetical protein
MPPQDKMITHILTMIMQLCIINDDKCTKAHIGKYAQMNQAIRQTSQLAHTIYKQLGSSKG